MSRLRAYQLSGSCIYKREAEAGLKATRETMIGWLRSGYEDYSLCHGISGNADVLLAGDRILGPPCEFDAALVNEAVDAIVKARVLTHNKNPSLMLGLAGIGYLFLRMCNPNLNSILLPTLD